MDNNKKLIILISTLFCVLALLLTQGIPFTASQFYSQVTDANYTLLMQGDYNGKILYMDWNKLTFIDANLSGGGGSVVPGGVNMDVQFNDNGVFGGDNNFTWDNNLGILTVKGEKDNAQNAVVFVDAGHTPGEIALDAIQASSLDGAGFVSLAQSVQGAQFNATAWNNTLPAVYVHQFKVGGTGLTVDATQNLFNGSVVVTNDMNANKFFQNGFRVCDVNNGLCGSSGSQTPWLSNINGGGNALENISGINDSSSKLSVDATNRQLIGSDGVTTILDWSNNFGQVNTNSNWAFGDSINVLNDINGGRVFQNGNEVCDKANSTGCSFGTATIDTNRQTARFANSQDAQLQDFNINHYDVKDVNNIYAKTVWDDANHTIGTIYCTDGNIIVGYLVGFSC